MEFERGDYVRSLSESINWEGTVTAVTSCEGKVLSVCVRVADPCGSIRRSKGDEILCRPEWLKIIRKREGS